MKIWAHRGCSQHYPENTLLAFEKAAGLQELTGIELDIHLTKDGQIVVIHDERVDRTTDGIGYVKDYTLAELKRLKIKAGNYPCQTIPTMEEVFELLKKRLKLGTEAERKPGITAELQLNIELKNSNFTYEGMEKKIIDMVRDRGLEDVVVYSTFYARSLEKIHYLDSEAELGILDTKVSDCMYKLKGGCKATALHPYWRAVDLSAKQMEGYIVRAWLTGHLYPEKPTGTRLDLAKLETQGITDVILNEPERYMGLEVEEDRYNADKLCNYS